MILKRIPWGRVAAGHIACHVVGFIRRTFRVRVNNDCRDEVVARTGKKHIYAILHAHQIAAFALSELDTGALVSRSRDGDILGPLLKANGCVPFRGSSGGVGKGGATALTQLIRHVNAGNPAVIAVDGPRGPRGVVQKGCAMLAAKTGAPILPVVMIPRRRFILRKAWDRLQLPVPFCELNCRFGDPIWVDPNDDLTFAAERVGQSLATLENALDPEEAEACQELSRLQIAKKAAKNAAIADKPASMRKAA